MATFLDRKVLLSYILLCPKPVPGSTHQGILAASKPSTGRVGETARLAGCYDQRMTTRDPADRAAEIAAQLVGDKIERVKVLASTVAAEEPVKELVEAAQRAHRAVDHQSATGDNIARALGAAQDALKLARQESGEQRKAALAAGWSTVDLAKMGLAAPRSPRRGASTDRSSTPPQSAPTTTAEQPDRSASTSPNSTPKATVDTSPENSIRETAAEQVSG